MWFVLNFRFFRTRFNSSKAFELLYKYCDELWLVLDLSLESYYLKTYNALFSEHFYGLTRSFESVSRKQNPILRSLLFSVILPYVKCKLDRAFESLREAEADGIVPSSRILRFSRIYLLRIYPYIHMIYECLHIFLSVAYTLGRSTHHHLSTKLAELILTQITPEAQSKFEEREQKSRDAAQVLPRIIRSFAKTLTFSLETGSFILQFMNYWYVEKSSIVVLHIFSHSKTIKKTRESYRTIELRW